MYSCHAPWPKSVVRLGVRSRLHVATCTYSTTGQWAVLVCDMEDSVEDRLAAVSRKLLRGTRVYAVDWCQYYCMLCCIPGTIHRTRTICTVHHVAASNMEPTELGTGEKVVYLVNEDESVWDPLCFHRRQLMLWLCLVKG